MTNDNISIELTQQQFNHVKNILAQSKPSRTRLTQDEKQTLKFLCKNFIRDIQYREDTTEDDILKINNIIKKLS